MYMVNNIYIQYIAQILNISSKGLIPCILYFLCSKLSKIFYFYCFFFPGKSQNAQGILLVTVSVIYNIRDIWVRVHVYGMREQL